MAVNLRKKYIGKKEVSKKNKAYRYQLDFYHGGKRIRETINEINYTCLPVYLSADSPACRQTGTIVITN